MIYDDKIKLIYAEFPDFKIVPKSSSKLMRAISNFLKFVTFGKANKFMTSFITTIGTTMYVPDNWDQHSEFSRYEIVSHELIHMRQARRYGMILFSLLYIFLPLPLGFAWFRTRFEMEAYEESLRIIRERKGIAGLQDPTLKPWLMNIFCGPDYGWMMAYRPYVSDWFDRTVNVLTSSP
jgi:hypothetical protein